MRKALKTLKCAELERDATDNHFMRCPHFVVADLITVSKPWNSSTLLPRPSTKQQIDRSKQSGY